MIKSIFTVAIFVTYWFQTNGQNSYFPSKFTDEWATVSTEALRWDNTQIDSLLEYLENKNSKAFIVLVDGKIAIEHYFGTFTKDSVWYWASAGKGITALLTGIAAEQGYLSLGDKVSKHLGSGWSSLTTEQEDSIRIIHNLTMTTGLNDAGADAFCTLAPCLTYKAEPGTRWAYHNAPYTLLESIIANSSNTNYNTYTQLNLKSKTGMTGLWVKSGFNNVFFSNARSMARFGLLMLNNCVWNGDSVLRNQDYYQKMTSSSQQINPAYGYLWWLNGKTFYKQPGLQLNFDGWLIPSAPSDMFAALGKNDQKIYVVPSKNMVVVRMGEEADESTLALSMFDNTLWKYINALEIKSNNKQTRNLPVEYIIKDKTIHFLSHQNNSQTISIYSQDGKCVYSNKLTPTVDLTHLPQKIFFLQIIDDENRIVLSQKIML
jgi:CubicO group peptidase (beta-lactamase class C family)